MHRNRSAKILATLGPASSEPERVRVLHEAGADAFRLNFSHGTHAHHAERYRAIRAVEEATGRPIGIVADLQGPKLRIGRFAGGRIELEVGQHFRLDLDPAPGDQTRVGLPHPEVYAVLEPGVELLLDDGKVRLAIERVGDGHAETRVLVGGLLSDSKGVNVPRAVLPISPLTEKDRQDLQFALDLGVDWIALSFVQRPEDVAEARRLIAGRAAIMVKVEKPAAVDHLDEIGNAQLVLGRSLLEQGRLDEADKLFSAAESSFDQLSSASHRAAAWIAQGDLAGRQGDDRRAARLYRCAAEALQDFHF